ENVIVGRLIPAGTGLAYHSKRRRNATGLTESELEALSGGSEPAAVAEVSEGAPAPDDAATCSLRPPPVTAAARGDGGAGMPGRTRPPAGLRASRGAGPGKGVG